MAGRFQTHNSSASEDNTVNILRMAGQSDVDLISAVGGLIEPDGHIIEFGPWLGGLTVLLAEFGPVSVVDRFEWSEQNAESYPEIAQVGENFRPIFERNLEGQGVKAQIFECDFKDFQWPGGNVSMVFLDAPRDGPGFQACLNSIWTHCHDTTKILLKNGLNPKYPALAAAVEVLLTRKIVELFPVKQPVWNHTAVLKPGKNWSDLEAFDLSTQNLASHPPGANTLDPWGGRRLTAARCAERIQDRDWKGALQLLSAFPKDPACLYAWDAQEIALEILDEDAAWAASFSDLLMEQTDPEPFPPDARGSISWTFRAWWRSNSGRQQQFEGFNVELLERAFMAGKFEQPLEALKLDPHSNIFEIGPNLALQATTFASAGVASYCGVETERLSAEMMKEEAHLLNVRYLPIESIQSGMQPDVSHILIHQAAGKEVLPILIKAFGEDRQVFWLDSDNMVPQLKKLAALEEL